MPRTRKPQSGVARPAGRVANTTTSSTKNVPNVQVYRIPTGRDKCCENGKVEIFGKAPIHVITHPTGEFEVQLNRNELKDVIQNFETLDLSNVEVTIGTLQGPVTIDGDLSITGKIAGTVNIDDAVIAQANVAEITVTDGTLSHIDIVSADIESANITSETVQSSNIANATISEETVNNSTINQLNTTNLHFTTGEGQELTVSRELTTEGKLVVEGGADFNSDVVFNEDLEVGGDLVARKLEVNEVSKFHGAISAEGNVNIERNLAVEGTTTTDKLIVDGNATVHGKTIFNETTTFNGTTNYNGPVVINGHTKVDTVEIEGQATFKDDVDIDKNLNVDGNEVVEGNLRVDGSLNVGHVSDFNENVTMDKNLHVIGDLQVDGKLYAKDIDIDIDLEDYQKINEKGMPNGYASLDANGKVPASQLDIDLDGLSYKGTFDPQSGFPANPSKGDFYISSGNGEINGQQVNTGDWAIYNGTSWDVVGSESAVSSVNGRTGVVTGLEEASNKIDAIDSVNPSTIKYTSEKAVSDALGTVTSSANSYTDSKLQDYYKKTETYNKTEVDNLIEQSGVVANNGKLTITQGNNTWEFYANQAGDTTINLAQGGGVSDAYTKAETDALLDLKSNVGHTHTISEVTGLDERVTELVNAQVTQAIDNAVTKSLIENRLGVNFKYAVVSINGSSAVYQDQAIKANTTISWTFQDNINGYLTFDVQQGQLTITSDADNGENGTVYLILVTPNS